MEILLKKNLSIEFEGKKYDLQGDATVEDLLTMLGVPKNKLVRMKPTLDGFILRS